MAEPKKTAQGTWRLQIEVKGRRESNTLPTKREAQQWGAKRSFELLTESAGSPGQLKTLGDALRKYAEEVSPTHRGEQWEVVRLTSYQKPGSSLPVKSLIGTITTAQLADWRDARLKATSPGSVLRDIGLLSAVLEAARLEWQWISVNPLKNMRRPSAPAHRNRLIADTEIRQILRSLGHTRHAPRSVSQAIAICFLLALSTGMRAGELCGLRWTEVRPDYVILFLTKNGKPRDVPLSPVARVLIERMRGFDSESVFGLQTQSLDALFRRARERAGLSGFTFHDSRHSAATRISRLVDVLTLCKIFGWTKTDQALTYYNPSASSIALRL
jgi:integrase